MEAVNAKKKEVARSRQVVLQRLEALAQESRILHDNLKDLDEKDRELDLEMARMKKETILCLPDEIICYIFEIARFQSASDYDHPNYSLWPRRYEQSIEITVSRVCHHWRQVAISCATLWSHVVIRSWYAGQSHSSAQRLSIYLTRSKEALLDIVVAIKASPYARESVDCTETLREVVQAVLPHSARWQRLVIWIDSSKWNMSPLTPLEKIAVPQLEVFEIGSWPIWDPYMLSSAPRVPDSLTLFELGAPRLLSTLAPVALRVYHHCHTISTIYLQRGAKHAPWDQFVALMRLPNLTNLTLDGQIFAAPSPNSDMTRTVARNLRHFRLGCCTVFQYMWDTLSAPQLELLLLFDIWGLNIANTQSEFPGGLFPALKTLAFWDFDIIERQDLLHLASATPQVTDIIICSCNPQQSFLTSLYGQSLVKNTQLWPHLQSLMYIIGNDYWFTGHLEPKEYTFEALRKVLLKFVDWRLETFGRECALWVDCPDYSSSAVQNTRRDDPFLYVPTFDDSEDEYILWMEHRMPWSRRIIPWPDEQTIHFGYHEKTRFDNMSVRALGY